MSRTSRRPYVPPIDTRRTQYQRNKESLSLVNAIDKKPFDWIVTIAFYAALHLVEYHLSQKKGRAHRLHADRSKLVVDDKELGEEVAKAYLALEIDCRAARYNCTPISQTRATDAISYLQTIENQLQ